MIGLFLCPLGAKPNLRLHPCGVSCAVPHGWMSALVFDSVQKNPKNFMTMYPSHPWPASCLDLCVFHPPSLGLVVALAGVPLCWPSHQDLYPLIPSPTLRLLHRPRWMSDILSFASTPVCLYDGSVFCSWVIVQLLTWFYSIGIGRWWWGDQGWKP